MHTCRHSAISRSSSDSNRAFVRYFTPWKGAVMPIASSSRAITSAEAAAAESASAGHDRSPPQSPPPDGVNAAAPAGALLRPFL